jgi:hypothetical protein
MTRELEGVRSWWESRLVRLERALVRPKRTCPDSSSALPGDPEPERPCVCHGADLQQACKAGAGAPLSVYFCLAHSWFESTAVFVSATVCFVRTARS